MSDAVSAGDVPEQEASPPPAPRRRSWLWYWSTRILALVVGAMVLSAVLLNTPIGHRFVADRIAALEPANGLRIKIGRIEGSLYSRMTLRNLTLSDPKGTFVTVPVAELDWRPFNWFVSGLDIRELTARRGTLLRVPKLKPGNPDDPWLPDFDIRVDKFRLDNFTVAEKVLGEKRRVDLAASALKRDRRAYLKVDGKLGGMDRIHALIDAFPERDRFDIDLDYQAPKGGLLAEMAGAKKDVSLRVVGDGTWTNWKGAFLARHDGERVAAFKLTNKDGLYGALGQAYPGTLITGMPKDLLGEAVGLGLNGRLENNVVNGSLRVQGRAIDVTAKGGVDLTNNTANALKIAGTLTRADALGTGMKLEGARFTVDLDGPFSDLTIPHTLAIDRVTSGAYQAAGIKQQGTLTYDGKTWRLPLDLAVAKIITGNGSVDPRLTNGRVRGQVALTGNQITSEQIKLAFPGLDGAFALRGDIAKGGYAIAGPVNASGVTLENLGTLNGHAKLIAKLTTHGDWQVQANFAGNMPRVANETLLTLTGGNIRFRGGVAMGSRRPLLFEKVALDANKLTLRMDGSVADGRTKIVGRGKHADYGPFTVDASMAGDGPRAVLVFASPLPAAGLKDVRVALAPIANGFGIDTSGQSMLGPFDGRVNLFMPTARPTRLEIERMAVSQTNVSGVLTLGKGGVTGDLALAGGGLDGVIGLAPRTGGQGFNVNLTARNARFAGSTPLTIRSGKIEATGVFGGKTMQASGSATAQGISYGQFYVGRLAAKAGIVDGRGTFNASLSGRRGVRFNLQLQGTTTPEQIALLAQGEFADHPITMPRRAILTKDRGGWALAPTQITYGDGIAIAQGRFGGSGGTDLKLQLADMSLSVLDIALTDMSLAGKISGIVDYHAKPGGLPTGQGRVEIKGLSRSGLVLTSRPIDLYLVADLSETALQARAAIREDSVRRGRIQARISGMSRSGGLLDRIYGGSLFAQVRYGGPADALWRMAAIDAFDLTGPLNVAADVTGTLTAPNVRGTLAGDDLRFRSSLTGTDIQKIRARGTFAGSTLRLTSFAGSARNGGRVSGSGTIDIGGLTEHGPVMDIRLAAVNAQVMNRKDLSASVTGPLRIVSNGYGGTIAGRLDIREAHWALGAMSSAASLPNIPTREINMAPDAAPRLRRTEPWRFLIDAKGNNRLYVRGMGLDSEWGANIQLRGTTSDMRIGGRAEVVRGTYEFSGTSFDLTRGRIAFDAGVPINPQLDIQADTKVDSLTVRVTVRGDAMKPEIAFSSTPALPEEELLARLLFGGSISNLSATDALQLGAAIASLRGGGGMDPINKLRSAIGLDRLRIIAADPARDQGTAIAAGKNFGRKFYAEIITDGRGYSATQVEFRVTSWLSLLGTVSTVGRQTALIKASKDY